MATAQEIQDAFGRVDDLTSLVNELLTDTLHWPVADRIDHPRKITYGWTAEELKAPGVEEKLLDGAVRQIRPFRTDQPWGIFLVEFTDERVYRTALRQVLRGLAAYGTEKKKLAARIQTEETKLRDGLDAAEDGSVDGRVAFAEVFRNGGFDIALENPPSWLHLHGRELLWQTEKLEQSTSAGRVHRRASRVHRQQTACNGGAPSRGRRHQTAFLDGRGPSPNPVIHRTDATGVYRPFACVSHGFRLGKLRCPHGPVKLCRG
ncbi:MAG: hypothetical protein K2R98_34465 [Gemmataceae bacterium]|nr:hypothetical protein [Gemmataceae bacterium]